MIRAVFGGSFDPVHDGHVAMAGHILQHGLAARVIVIPNRRSPWRGEPLASAVDRLAMCRLAFAALPEVSVDDRELAGNGPRYTVDTLATLAQEHPGDRFRLVIGADHLATFNRWHEPGRLLSLAELIVLDRAGLATDPAAVARAGLPPDRVIIAPPFSHPVSASAVRAMLAAGEPTGALLPPPVSAYIAAHRLYRVA